MERLGAAIDLLVSNTLESTLASKFQIDLRSARALLDDAGGDHELAQALAATCTPPDSSLRWQVLYHRWVTQKQSTSVHFTSRSPLKSNSRVRRMSVPCRGARHHHFPTAAQPDARCCHWVEREEIAAAERRRRQLAIQAKIARVFGDPVVEPEAVETNLSETVHVEHTPAYRLAQYVMHAADRHSRNNQLTVSELRSFLGDHPFVLWLLRDRAQILRYDIDRSGAFDFNELERAAVDWLAINQGASGVPTGSADMTQQDSSDIAHDDGVNTEFQSEEHQLQLSDDLSGRMRRTYIPEAWTEGCTHPPCTRCGIRRCKGYVDHLGKYWCRGARTMPF